jgi:hypothetical protein
VGNIGAVEASTAKNREDQVSEAKYRADRGLGTRTMVEAEGGTVDPVRTCATSFRLDIRLHQAS